MQDFNYTIYEHLRAHNNTHTLLAGGIWRQRPDTNMMPYMHLGGTICDYTTLNTLDVIDIKQTISVYIAPSNNNGLTLINQIAKLIKNLFNKSFNLLNFKLSHIEAIPVGDGRIWQYLTIINIKISSNVGTI